MPEGHTLHRLARDLDELTGHSLHAVSPQGRFTAGAAELDGAVLESPEAYGKHLFLRMASGRHLHVHLGMQGKWFRYADPGVPPMRQVRLRLSTGEVAWDLIAPATCEIVGNAAMTKLVQQLGPDPLRADADEALAIQSLRSAPGAIGAVLLDQGVVAGVGNVFRAEALHAVGVAPHRPGHSMSEAELGRLWSVLKRMMSQAVDDGRIVTVEGPDRLSVPESESRKVYKQASCRDCGAPVTTSTVGGRTAYHCPMDQPD